MAGKLQAQPRIVLLWKSWDLPPFSKPYSSALERGPRRLDASSSGAWQMLWVLPEAVCNFEILAMPLTEHLLSCS